MYIMEKDNAVRYAPGLKERNKLIDLGYKEVSEGVKTPAAGKAKKAVRDETDGS